MGSSLARKQAQLNTTYRTSDEGRAIKGLAVCWMLLNLISYSGRYSIDPNYKRMIPFGSLDDHLKSMENPNRIR